MSVVSYGEYQGSVDYEDGVLVIQILHIDDIITTECEAAAEAQKAFEQLVDDYVETCKEQGKEPCKPFKGSFNVRVPPQLHRQAVYAATAEGLSLNAWVQKAIEARLQKRADLFLETQKVMDLIQKGHQQSDNHWALAIREIRGSRDNNDAPSYLSIAKFQISYAGERHDH